MYCDINIGDRIRIIEMGGEPQMSGKEGIVTEIVTDPWGDICVGGTWGSLSMYPHIDTYEILERGGNK